MKGQIKFRKKIVLAVLIVAAAVLLGFVGYLLYGSYKLEQLAKMSAAQMIAYTTEDKKEAIITVGIIKDGEMTYTVYGENGKVIAPKEYTYEIGSITKTFTTSLLCKALSENRIRLDDPIDKYLSLPSKKYYPTIKRLVTHTSGYKKYYFERPMVSNFINRRNDFYGINEDLLVRRIGMVDLEDRDSQFKYSNFGFAVLGVVLESVYSEEYRLLMDNYIKNDLGLTNTRLSDGSGVLVNDWDWAASDAYLPAGALLSNVTDMMTYAKMQMRNTPAYLSIAHKSLATINASSSSNQKMGIFMDEAGVGWMKDQKNNIIWHNGATGNYNCYLGFDQERQIAVVVLSNLPPKYKIPATVIGIEILTTLQK